MTAPRLDATDPEMLRLLADRMPEAVNRDIREALDTAAQDEATTRAQSHLMRRVSRHATPEEFRAMIARYHAEIDR